MKMHVFVLPRSYRIRITSTCTRSSYVRTYAPEYLTLFPHPLSNPLIPSSFATSPPSPSPHRSQVLNHEWTSILLNMNTEGLPHVARWWLDVATLVLWSSNSELDFVRLRWLYPDASVMLVSRDLESATRAMAAAIKASSHQSAWVRRLRDRTAADRSAEGEGGGVGFGGSKFSGLGLPREEWEVSRCAWSQFFSVVLSCQGNGFFSKNIVLQVHC